MKSTKNADGFNPRTDREMRLCKEIRKLRKELRNKSRKVSLLEKANRMLVQRFSWRDDGAGYGIDMDWC